MSVFVCHRGENAGRVDQFRRTSRDLTHGECASGRLSRRSWIGARFRHHPRQFEDPTLLGDLCTFAERWNSKAARLTSSVTGFQETKSPNAGNVEMGNVKAENTCGEGLLKRIGKEEPEAVTAPSLELQSENAGAAALRFFRNQSTSEQKCRRWGLKQTDNQKTAGISSSSTAMETELKRATGWRSRQHWQSKPIGSTWSQSVLLWDWAVRNDDSHERRSVRDFLQRAHVEGRVARGSSFVLRLVPWMGFLMRRTEV